MKSNGLSTDKVVTSSDVLGDGEGTLAAVGVEDLGSPGGGGSSVAVLCNLEEGAAGGGFGVCDLGHVDHDGSVMVSTNSGLAAAAVAVLCMHLNGEGAASFLVR